MLGQILYIRAIHWAGLGEGEGAAAIDLETCLRELIAIGCDGKRGLALKFAALSLQRIPQQGFIQVSIDVSNYVTFLRACCEASKKSVYATCTVRPLWFQEGPGRSNHFDAFLKPGEPEFGKRIRIVVLDDQDVAWIVQDTLENLVMGAGKGKAKVYDLPEAQFLADEIVDEHTDRDQRFLVYWALQSDLQRRADAGEWFSDDVRDARKLIPDYVVFDADLSRTV